ncbi:MAG: 3-oxoacyl-ACP reductase, partial [Spirochaetota bacterium]
LIGCNSKSRTESLKEQFKKEIQNVQVQIIFGDSHLGIEELSDKTIDWLFLNTDNSYENTTVLLEASQSKVKDAGLIIGSNYTMGDWMTSQRFGVVEAVNTFSKKYGWELLYLTNESNRNLSYALRRIHH